MRLSKAKKQQVYKALQSIVDKTNIQDKIIYEENGVYCLFEKYTISKTVDGFVANKIGFDTVETFSQLKNAVSWATLDKLNRFKEANRVLDLDRKLTDAKIQAQVHERMCKLAKDIDGYVLYKAKLQEDLVKKSMISRELEGFVEQTKRWQYNTFKEATK